MSHTGGLSHWDVLGRFDDLDTGAPTARPPP